MDALSRRPTSSTNGGGGNNTNNLSNDARVCRPPLLEHPTVSIKQFEFLRKLGQGTFGIVYKARSLKRDGKLVAIKHCLCRTVDSTLTITTLREITTLKLLKHKNIIELVDIITGGQDEFLASHIQKANNYNLKQTLCMVFPYMSNDLTGILQNEAITLTELDRKSIMLQLLRGVEYIHNKGYLHRDIKASNILIHRSGMLKIADFGLVRKYRGPPPTLDKQAGDERPYTEIVMTRWYRAPEVLFGNRFYGTAVDLWGVGCVMGELYHKEPILKGETDIDQAIKVFDLCGPPSPNMLKFDAWKSKNSVVSAQIPRSATLRTRFSQLSPDALDLLEGLLRVDPKTRFTSLKAFESAYFIDDDVPEKVNVTFGECHEADALRTRASRRDQSKLGNAIPQMPQSHGPQTGPYASVPPPHLMQSQFSGVKSLPSSPTPSNHIPLKQQQQPQQQHQRNYNHPSNPRGGALGGFDQPPLQRNYGGPPPGVRGGYGGGNGGGNGARMGMGYKRNIPNKKFINDESSSGISHSGRHPDAQTHIDNSIDHYQQQRQQPRRYGYDDRPSRPDGPGGDRASGGMRYGGNGQYQPHDEGQRPYPQGPPKGPSGDGVHQNRDRKDPQQRYDDRHERFDDRYRRDNRQQQQQQYGGHWGRNMGYASRNSREQYSRGSNGKHRTPEKSNNQDQLYSSSAQPQQQHMHGGGPSAVSRQRESYGVSSQMSQKEQSQEKQAQKQHEQPADSQVSKSQKTDERQGPKGDEPPEKKPRINAGY